MKHGISLIHGLINRLAGALFLCTLLAGSAVQAQDDEDNGGWTDTDITEVLNAVREVRNRIESGHTHLAGLRDTIEEAIGDLKSQVQEMNQGRAEFLGNGCDASSPCGQFRADLVRLLENFGAINSGLMKVTAMEGQSGFQPLITLIQNAPGRALYPLFVVLDREMALVRPGFLDSLSELALDVEFLVAAIQAPLGKSSIAQIDQCALLLDNPELSQKAILGTTIGSVSFTVVGYGLIAAGETHLEAKAGVHGYPGILIKNNLRKKFGNGFVGLGKGLASLAGAASDRHRYCLTVEFRERTLANQMMILANQEKLWNALPPGWTRGDDILRPDAP